MFEKIINALLGVDPSIYAEIINTLGLILIGYAINRNISKLNNQIQIQLARETPTYELKIEENRKFIAAHFDLIDDCMNIFYHSPNKYLEPLVHKSNMMGNVGLDEYARELLRKDLKLEIIDNFDNYIKEHTIIFSLYFSLTPFPPHPVIKNLKEKHLSDLVKNSLFINDKIMKISNEILIHINHICKRNAYREVLKNLDEKEVPYFNKYVEFDSFWEQQEIILNKMARNMQKEFIEEWNKNLIV